MMSKYTIGLRTLGSLLVTAAMVVGAPAAYAADDKAGTSKCLQSADEPILSSAGAGSSSRATAGASTRLSDSAVAQYKATHDTVAAEIASLRTDETLQDARKRAKIASRGLQPGSGCVQHDGRSIAPSYTSGPGYAYISWMRQYGQTKSFYCGPATVAEMSATVPGPSPIGLNQDEAANYMGTTTNGTDVGAMVNGLNHFVGVPDFGFNFYSFVWMDYNPTASQRSAFLSRLQFDVQYNSPVAGDAWEGIGGPHLPGHPVNQEIFHWFEIGGWNTNTSQVWFADSATTSWNGVPAYSVYDTYTLGTILGGRGYIW